MLSRAVKLFNHLTESSAATEHRVATSFHQGLSVKPPLFLTYRGNRYVSPEMAFSEGYKALGRQNSVEDHVESPDLSRYISTSTRCSIATVFARHGGYVYSIGLTSGVDIPQMSAFFVSADQETRMQWGTLENEFAADLFISPDQIQAARRVISLDQGKFLNSVFPKYTFSSEIWINPNYKPSAFIITFPSVHENEHQIFEAKLKQYGAIDKANRCLTIDEVRAVEQALKDVESNYNIHHCKSVFLINSVGENLSGDAMIHAMQDKYNGFLKQQTEQKTTRIFYSQSQNPKLNEPTKSISDFVLLTLFGEKRLNNNNIVTHENVDCLKQPKNN